MAGERPTRDELQRGMTVEIEQTGAENADDAPPIRGDIQQILDDEHSEPGGIEVKLESGVTGRVRRIAPDE